MEKQMLLNNLTALYIAIDCHRQAPGCLSVPSQCPLKKLYKGGMYHTLEEGMFVFNESVEEGTTKEIRNRGELKETMNLYMLISLNVGDFFHNGYIISPNCTLIIILF